MSVTTSIKPNDDELDNYILEILVEWRYHVENLSTWDDMLPSEAIVKKIKSLFSESVPKYNKVTRLEVIEPVAKCGVCHGVGKMDFFGDRMNCVGCNGGGYTGGRKVIMRDDNSKIDLSLQDDDRTLKIFVNKRS